MSLLRYDLTTNDWVIFAPERSRRPHEWKQALEQGEHPKRAAGPCPFCPGSEGMTGQEICAVRSSSTPNAPDWRVRVIPNKFPALRIEEESLRFQEGPVFRYMGGCGAHEVIIESPEHDRILAQHPVDHIELVIRTLQQRFNDLLKDRRFQSIVIFKNHGEQAGTSLRHPHCQLIATPVVPQMLRWRHRIATEYFDQMGRCLYCVLMQEELSAGRRVVAENSDFAAIAPYASHVPFELRICPKQHQASFGWIDAGQLKSLAELLKTVLTKLYIGLDNPDFNLTINTAPRGDEDEDYFLWHLQILPRLTTAAGFELGSGMSINPVLPEEAADFLRTI
jgi:UDPglucose--hexose-1-phosphate uridylyltransferase